MNCKQCQFRVANACVFDIHFWQEVCPMIGSAYCETYNSKSDEEVYEVLVWGNDFCSYRERKDDGKNSID